MSKKIIRNVQRFELPEDKRRRELIEQMNPLLQELAKLQKTEKQSEIDNKIIEASGKLIKVIREGGLEIDMSQIKVEPLWPDAVVLTERKCVMDVEYEENTTEHATSVKMRIIINSGGLTVGVKVECSTPFENFMNPAASSILLLNDDVSNAHNTSVSISKSEKPVITMAALDGSGDSEFQRTGGMFEVSFELKFNHDGNVEQAITAIREVSSRFASSTVFERGLIAVRYLDTQGRQVRDDEEITEGQFMDRFMSRI